MGADSWCLLVTVAAMDSSSAAFLSGDQKNMAITVKKSTAALMMAAVFCAGALASWSMSGFGPGPSKAVTLLGSVPGSQQAPTSAMELLTQYGTNATVLEPTMLYYRNNCILCHTCGGIYSVEVADLSWANSRSLFNWEEWGAYCDLTSTMYSV